MNIYSLKIYLIFIYYIALFIFLSYFIIINN